MSNTLATPTRKTGPSSSPNRNNSISNISNSRVITSSSSSIQGSDKKKKARELLRDYYKLGGGINSTKGDPLDIDSTNGFDSIAYFDNLSAKSSLPELLKRENELLTEIRELDGERQSLVYNHHHELIEASDTIRKMKSRALALDASLDSVKTSFESISQLSTSLSSSRPPFSPPLPLPSSSDSLPRSITPPLPPSNIKSPNRRLSTLPEQLSPISTSFQTSPSSLPTPTSIEPESEPELNFNPLIHLPALISLPILLKTSLNSNSITYRNQIELWGAFEISLRSWEEAGIEGVNDIARECREVLKSRRASVGEGKNLG